MPEVEIKPECIEVGTSANHDVIILHRNLVADENGVGYVSLSPTQARDMASKLLKFAKHAQQAQRALRRAKVN